MSQPVTPPVGKLVSDGRVTSQEHSLLLVELGWERRPLPGCFTIPSVLVELMVCCLLRN